MIHTLLKLNYLVVLGVAVAGFVLGSLWYSPLLFAKAWMKEMGLTPQDCQGGKSKMVRMLGSTFVLTFISTAVLAVLVSEHQLIAQGAPSLGLLGGAKVGLFVGVGLVAARECVNHLFSMKSWKLFLIVTGHDIVLCTLQGALLGQFLWPK